MNIICNIGFNSHLYFFPIIKKSIELTLEINLQQQGAQAHIAGYYVLKNDQQATIKTMQHHNAPNTRSTLALNGILYDASQVVYDGTILIEQHANYSDASQSNKNMLFGPKARAISVPNLEVKNHEVQCKHGSAVGQIDPEQLFYMQTRGLNSESAKKMLLDGFIKEVFKGVPKDIQIFIENR